MIDGLKFRLNPDVIRSNKALEFRSNGEGRQVAKYKGLHFELYDDSPFCSVRGSLHKYRNKGLHNADDFPLSDFIRTLKDLSASFNFNPEMTEFYSVEFGVNIEFNSGLQGLIDSIIYYNNGALFRDKLGIRFKFTEYEVKIYRKGKNILRYEIKFKKKKIRRLIKKDVTYCNTLLDLSDSNVWRSFGNELLNIFDDILIVDKSSIHINILTNKEKELYVNGINREYWSRHWHDRMDKSRQLSRFKALIGKYSTSTLKQDIRNKIAEKINTLIDQENIAFSSSQNINVEAVKSVTISTLG